MQIVIYIEINFQTIEDSKTAIVFTTERIICSLADVLRGFDHIAEGAAAHFDFFNSCSSYLKSIYRLPYRLLPCVNCSVWTIE